MKYRGACLHFGVRLVACCLLSLIALLGASSSVSAHASSDVRATNFENKMREVVPQFNNATLRVTDLGDKLTLVNNSHEEVLVLGYDKEPYLRISNNGVFENKNSPAAYLNRDVYGRVTVPPTVSAGSPAEWQKVANGNSFSWHDHRVHWMSETPPPIVRRNPGVEHVIYDRWEVLFAQGDRQISAVGSLRWVPTSTSAPWWVLVGAIVAFGAVLGFAKHRRLLLVARAVVGLCVALVIFDVVRIVTAAMTFQGSAASVAGQTVFAMLPHALAWAALVWTIWSAIRVLRRSGREEDGKKLQLWPAAFGGAVVVVVCATTWLGDLTHSQLPVAGPHWLARLSVASCLGVGSSLIALFLVDRFAERGQGSRVRQSRDHDDVPVHLLPRAN